MSSFVALPLGASLTLDLRSSRLRAEWLSDSTFPTRTVHHVRHRACESCSLLQRQRHLIPDETTGLPRQKHVPPSGSEAPAAWLTQAFAPLSPFASSLQVPSCTLSCVSSAAERHGRSHKICGGGVGRRAGRGARRIWDGAKDTMSSPSRSPAFAHSSAQVACSDSAEMLVRRVDEHCLSHGSPAVSNLGKGSIGATGSSPGLNTPRSPCLEASGSEARLRDRSTVWTNVDGTLSWSIRLKPGRRPRDKILGGWQIIEQARRAAVEPHANQTNAVKNLSCPSCVLRHLAAARCSRP